MLPVLFYQVQEIHLLVCDASAAYFYKLNELRYEVVCRGLTGTLFLYRSLLGFFSNPVFYFFFPWFLWSEIYLSSYHLCNYKKSVC